MPTYEYLCQTCSHRFETWQKMADEPLTVCPECGNHIRRVLYPAGVVFKGSGFYKTDHASNGQPASNGEKKPAETNTESKTTSESNTATSTTNTTSNGTTATKSESSKTSSNT